MLGKSKKAIPSAAMSAETSGCATKEGILKKKNSKGEWKERFCYFSNSFFLTYKPNKANNGPSSELKESVDLKLVKSVAAVLDVIEIETKAGEKMEFKGSSVAEVQEWVEIMHARADWACGRDANSPGTRQRSGSSTTTAIPALEGFLFKKNSKGEWKRRFCACKPHAFVGYKENSSHEIKENVEYKDILRVSIGQNEKGRPTIEIDVRGGEKIVFQTEKAREWKEGLELRVEAAQVPPSSPAHSPVPAHSFASSSSNVALSKAHESELVSLEGILKKKNSKGEWKERHCLFEKHFFKAFKTNRGKATTECKESIDLKDIETVDCISSDVLQIELKQGDILLFKGSTALEWLHALQARMLFVQREYANTLQENLLNTVHIEGFLLKKSHNKYQGLQERYVRVEGLSLKYYKEKDDKFDSPLGSIDLAKSEFVRPFSESADCLIFEVHDDGDKTYKFQAASHKEMLHWVSVCEKLLVAQKERIEALNRAKIAKETPLRVKWFDEEGESYWLTEIRADFESMYADPESESGRGMTIKDHLSCASEVVGYLTDFVPEVQRCETRPARFDILALMLTEVNAFLSKRFFSFLPHPSASDEDEERSELLENANLGDVHAMLNWITGYQSTLRGIRCPVCVNKDTPAVTPHTVLSTKYLSPKQCGLFDVIPALCKLYVYGGSTGAKGGAAVTLHEHCLRVWQNCIAQPEESLQRRNDGTFFTHTPIDMWEAINLHISLATATRTPILHVMIADKIVSTLNDLFDRMIRYINTVDSSQNPALREVELEFFSALANDTALHIEEVVNLIDQFDIDEIRQKIDDIFDPLTTNLVNCGQACLSRLARLVLSDVQGQMNEVFQEEWMEGNQMHVVTATVTDYMSDFEDYLVPFWSQKFVNTVFEEIIVTYTRSLLFRKSYGITSTITSSVSAGEEGETTGERSRFMSNLFQKTKQAAQSIVTTTTVYTPSHVPVDAEALGRLAQDVNILNSFFSQKAGQDRATEFLVIINEVSILLFVDLNGLVAHLYKCLQQFPSALPAVREVALATMKLRPDDFSQEDVEKFKEIVQPLMMQAVRDAAEKEEQGIAEEKLGLLYIEVVPKEILHTSQNRLSLAQRNKLMSNVSLGNAQRATKRDEDDDNDEDEPSSSAQLVEDVIGVLQQMDEEDVEFINEKEEAALEKELHKSKIGVLKYDGDLEKKSPAHNLWQKRYFKLMTKETFIEEKPYLYSFMWYKKEGGAVIKSLDMDQILSLAVVQTQRPLVYVPLRKNPFMLKIEAGADPTAVPVQPLEEIETSSAKNVGVETYIFMVTQQDGKEHILKSAKVDRMLKWMNLLSLAGGLAYDPHTRRWTRNMLTVYEERAAERAKLQSFQTVTATPLAPFGGNSNAPVPANVPVSVSVTPSVEHDQESAVALIAAMREKEKQQQQEREREEQEQRERERLRAEEEERERQRVLREESEKQARLEQEKAQALAQDRENERIKQQQQQQKQQTQTPTPMETANPIGAGAKTGTVSAANPLMRRTPPPPSNNTTNSNNNSNTSPAALVPPPPAVSPSPSDGSSSSPVASGAAGTRKIVVSKRVKLNKTRRAAANANSTGEDEENSGAAAEEESDSRISNVMATDFANVAKAMTVAAATKANTAARPPPPPRPATLSPPQTHAHNIAKTSPALAPSIPAATPASAVPIPVSTSPSKQADTASTVTTSPMVAERTQDTKEKERNEDHSDDDDSSAGAGSDNDDEEDDSEAEEQEEQEEQEDPAIVAKRERENAFRAELDSIFPEEDAPLRRLVSLAGETVAHWQSLLAEEERDALREVFNDFLSERLGDALCTESESLEEASLSEILAAIDFLVRLKQLMRESCVREKGRESERDSMKDENAQTFMQTQSTSVCEQLPVLCKLYVSGGTAGARGGISAQLQDGGVRLWTAITQSPDTQLTKVDALPSLGLSVCEVISKAIEEVKTLSESETATRLQTQVREIARSSWRQLLDAMIAFVSNADFSSKFADPQTKYHLLCAVLNDVERNGDKWLNCLEEERDFVAQRLQSLRAVTQQRMRALCVGECVSLFDQVFLPVWLTEEDDEDEEEDDSEAENEEREPHVKTEHPTRKAVRILNERLTFCEESLVENEKSALIVPVLEGVVVQFVKSLLFRRNISNPPPLNQKAGFFSGMYQKAKQALLPPHVHVDSESMARLSLDINLINNFLVKHGGPETAAELLPMLHEVSFMLVADFQSLVQHFGQCAAESPRSLIALREVALSTMRMRSNDFTKADMDKFSQVIQPLLDSSSALVSEDASSQQGLSRVGALYLRVC